LQSIISFDVGLVIRRGRIGVIIVPSEVNHVHIIGQRDTTANSSLDARWQDNVPWDIFSFINLPKTTPRRGKGQQDRRRGPKRS